MTNKDLESASKYISLILRHKPETIGITLDEHGWANVDELKERYPIRNTSPTVNSVSVTLCDACDAILATEGGVRISVTKRHSVTAFTFACPVLQDKAALGIGPRHRDKLNAELIEEDRDIDIQLSAQGMGLNVRQLHLLDQIRGGS